MPKQAVKKSPGQKKHQQREVPSEKPAVRLDGTFRQLFDAGCVQTGADICQTFEATETFFQGHFGALMKDMDHNPCPKCPAFKGGLCEAYDIYHTSAQEAREKLALEKKQNATKPPGTSKYPHLSVKQIAGELGISVSEVRRRKAQGLL